MVICDRGFCDLWTLAERKFYTKMAIPMLKYGTLGWQVQNAHHFLERPVNSERPCYKLIMCDKADEMIDVYCSLMIGVAKEICLV